MPFLFYAFVTFLLPEGSSRSRFQAYNFGHRVLWFCSDWLDQLLWRNWLARSAVKQRFGGSTPARSECVFNFHAFVTIPSRESSSSSRFQAYNSGDRVL